MITRIAIVSISVYQLFFSSLLHVVLGTRTLCRYRPTCSAFMKQMIQTYGVRKGGVMGLRQLLSCHPFTRAAV